MVFKITYAQIRTFLITFAALLAVWMIMGHCARFKIMENSPEGQVTVNISFLAPMNHQGTEERLTITGEIPGRKVSYRTHWVSRNTLQVTIDESEFPRGLEYNLEFKKAPALIPPFTVTAHKKVRMSLVPRVIALEPQKNIPSGGPLVMVFNTPVDPESFREHVFTNAPGKFSPREAGNGRAGPRYDYSRWVLLPEKRFGNSAIYKISVTGGLRSAGGGTASEGSELSFTTAPALETTEIYPRPYAPSIWLSRNIAVKTNQELKEARIEVEGVAGKVSVNGNTAVFDPDGLFLPAQKYRVSISLTSVYGEKLYKEFWFNTTNLGSQRWIGIKLGNPCSVQVYEGNKILKSFSGWLTIHQDKVPPVTMYEVKRGSTLEFNPRDTSPARYIELNADIMIHHLRPGESHNHSLAGLPSSYGCILLNKPDLDWIFSSVPGNCMVVVH
ncbi:MAG: L,D-transpeptidase family protein [Bacillota bacterium]